MTLASHKTKAESPVCKACQAALDPAKNIGSKNGYVLLRCPQCGTVTVDPFPGIEELAAFYQSYKGTADYRAKQDKKIGRAKKRIKRMMPHAPGKTFLDVGCNYGFTVAAALELGLDAHGIDIDGKAVADSAKTFGEKHFTAISIQDYAAAGRKADMIYTSEVIEHVPDPDGFVKALAQALNKGGILFLTTPDGGHFTLPRDFTRWDAVIPPEHIVYFTRTGLRRLLEKHGLRVKKFAFAFKPGIQLLAEKI